jgi:hypothetical protein
MRKRDVIPSGTTTVPGTLPVVELDSDPDDICMELFVEIAGATPAISYKWQGSVDGTVWFDLMYITDASDTPATAVRAITPTTGSSTLQWRSNSLRRYRFLRCVPSAITNVTYRASIYEYD